MPPSSSNLKVCKVTFLHPLSKTRPHYVKATLHLRHLATLQLYNMARLASQAAFSAMHLFSWDLKRMRCIFDFVNAGQELPHKKNYRFVCWVPVPVALCAVTLGFLRYVTPSLHGTKRSPAISSLITAGVQCSTFGNLFRSDSVQLCGHNTAERRRTQSWITRKNL